MSLLHNLTQKIGTRHVQALLLFFANSIAYGMRTCISVAIVAMTDTETNSTVQTFKWESEQKSMILSSLLWGCVAFQIPMGFMIRTRGSQKLLFYGILICSIINMLTPVMAIHLGWIAVLCSRIAMGIGQSCLTPCLKALISKWVPPPERAQLGSFILNGPQLGNVVSMSVSGLLAASSIGWPSIFYTFGSIGIIWSGFFYWLGADSPAEHKNISPKEKLFIENSFGESEGNVDAKDLKFPWKSVLLSIPVWALLITNCSQIWSYYMLLSEMPTYMKYVLNYDIKTSGVISSLPYLTKWLLAFPISWLSDFALRKGAPVTLVRKICNTIGMWGPALMLLILCLVKTTEPTAAVAILVMTVGLDAATTCGQEINEIDLCPNFSGTLASIINTFGKFCGLLAPIICGIIVTDPTSSSQWYIIFYISIIFYFFGNLAFVIFGKAEIQPWNGQVSSKMPGNDEGFRSRLSTMSKISHIHES